MLIGRHKITTDILMVYYILTKCNSVYVLLLVDFLLTLLSRYYPTSIALLASKLQHQSFIASLTMQGHALPRPHQPFSDQPCACCPDLG